MNFRDTWTMSTRTIIIPTICWRYDSRTGTDCWEYFPENQAGQNELYMDDLFTTAALNFVRINQPDQFNHYRPFFLYLAYTIPHANNEEAKRSGNGMQVPDDAPIRASPGLRLRRTRPP